MRSLFVCARPLARIAIVWGGLCGLIALAAPQQAHAGLFTLIDGNSVANFDTASPANNYNWIVDASDKLAQQAFWYRVGNTAESSVHTLPIALEGATDTNFDTNLDTLFVRYTGASFKIETTYTLRGGAVSSGASDMGELIAITNTGASPLDFHFFQYADFDLSASADTITFTNGNAVQQSGSSQLTETVITPLPSHRESAFFPTTLNKLNDGVATTLSDTPAIGVPIGPGDMTWAYQWDVTIAPGDTFQISKDKNMEALPIPEPATIALLGICAGLLAARRPRR